MSHFHPSRRVLLKQACLAAACALPGARALASETWNPTKPIRLVIPFAPGGGGDVIARQFTDPLGRLLGQPVIAENKAGASGSIASDYVYRAAPDGYTLLVATLDSQGMYPHVAKVGFDSSKYVPVGGMAQMGYALMGRAGMPETFQGLLELLKTKPLSYGSGGAGSSLHVFMELFAKETGSRLLHVPYKGAGPALQDLLAGQIDLMPVPLATGPQHRSRLVAYGITSGERSPAMKDVPTLKELGVNVVGDSWVAVVAPPGTPDAAAQRVGEALQKIVQDPAISKRLVEMGMTPMTMTRAEFADFYLAEDRKWGAVIRDANIKLDE